MMNKIKSHALWVQVVAIALAFVFFVKSNGQVDDLSYLLFTVVIFSGSVWKIVDYIKAAPYIQDVSVFAMPIPELLATARFVYLRAFEVEAVFGYGVEVFGVPAEHLLVIGLPVLSLFGTLLAADFDLKNFGQPSNAAQKTM